MSLVSDMIKYARLTWDLRAFLHNTITLEKRKQVLSDRPHNRGNNSLNLVQNCVNGNPQRPYLPGHYCVPSSGSRSAGPRTAIDLRFILDPSYYRLPAYVVNDAWDCPAGIWLAELPSEAGISNLLRYQIMGKPLAKWFSPVTENQEQAALPGKLAMRYIIYGGRLWGARFVKPEHVSLAEAVKVAEWMAAARREFGGCCLTCFPRPAVQC